MNSGSRCMRKRVFGSLPNQPARRGKFVIGRVSLMDERARDRARTGVEIFIGTPNREIDVPIVQCQRNVADGVGKIDPDDDSALLRRGRDFRDVE